MLLLFSNMQCQPGLACGRLFSDLFYLNGSRFCVTVFAASRLTYFIWIFVVATDLLSVGGATWWFQLIVGKWELRIASIFLIIISSKDVPTDWVKNYVKASRTLVIHPLSRVGKRVKATSAMTIVQAEQLLYLRSALTQLLQTSNEELILSTQWPKHSAVCIDSQQVMVLKTTLPFLEECPWRV